MKNRNRYFVRHAVIMTMLLLVLCAAASGITYAYLHADPGTAVNVITVGEIAIDLQEESWDPSAAEDLHPGESAAKDPVITNIGSHPAYVFLEVTVPMCDFATVDEDGKKEESKIQQLFQFEADPKSWELVDEKVKSGKAVYVYGYRSVLKPGQSTEALFNEVFAVNYLEGSVDAEEIFGIDITAYAIQARLQTTPQLMAEVYAEFISQINRDNMEMEEAAYEK